MLRIGMLSSASTAGRRRPLLAALTILTTAVLAVAGTEPATASAEERDEPGRVAVEQRGGAPPGIGGAAAGAAISAGWLHSCALRGRRLRDLLGRRRPRPGLAASGRLLLRQRGLLPQLRRPARRLPRLLGPGRLRAGLAAGGGLPLRQLGLAPQLRPP